MSPVLMATQLVIYHFSLDCHRSLEIHNKITHFQNNPLVCAFLVLEVHLISSPCFTSICFSWQMVFSKQSLECVCVGKIVVWDWNKEAELGFPVLVPPFQDWAYIGKTLLLLAFLICSTFKETTCLAFTLWLRNAVSEENSVVVKFLKQQ